MSFTRMQPTFFVRLDRSAGDASRFLRQAIAQQGLDKASRAVGNCIEMFVPVKQRRFWSPHLSVQIFDLPEGSELVGKFSPRPEIWTMVMFLYGGMWFVLLSGMIFAWSQWIAKQAPWGLASVPLALLGILGLHTVSWVGQQWSRDQMEELREKLKSLLEPIAVSEWERSSAQ